MEVPGELRNFRGSWENADGSSMIFEQLLLHVILGKAGDGCIEGWRQ